MYITIFKFPFLSPKCKLRFNFIISHPRSDNTSKLETSDNSEGNEDKSVFSVYMESMPEGCNTILDSYISSNGRSFGALDLQLTFNLKLFLCEFLSTRQDVNETKR